MVYGSVCGSEYARRGEREGGGGGRASKTLSSLCRSKYRTKMNASMCDVKYKVEPKQHQVPSLGQLHLQIMFTLPAGG